MLGNFAIAPWLLKCILVSLPAQQGLEFSRPAIVLAVLPTMLPLQLFSVLVEGTSSIDKTFVLESEYVEGLAFAA
jgi:hypothetical protein